MDLKTAIEKYIQENGLLEKAKSKNIKIDDICNYITEQARKELDSKNGAIEDKVVYGWAVHYIEDAYKEKEQVEKVEEKEEKTKTKEEYSQMSLFGGDL